MINISIKCCTFADVNLRQINYISKKMTANEAFDNYMSSLSSKERIAKSRDLRELGQISKSVITNWRRGRTPIDVAWRGKISEIIGKKIFENSQID